MNELLLIAGPVLGVVFSVWVFFDARKRKNRSLGWSVLTFMLGPFLILPLYFAYRNLKTGEIRVGGTVWHIFRNYTLSWTVLVFFTAFLMILVLDPEEGLGVTFIMGIIWFFVAVFIMFVGLFFKQSDVVEKGPAPE